jgi:DNA-directed RNA polymerase II subunit RPB2
MLFHQEDMPFTESGITPDLIMNPHAVPSRMTIGQLKEKLLGKASCFQGKFGDATPFTNVKIEELGSILQDECGFHKHGHEILYNGATGEQLKADIFIGPTFYQRLKHMVNDKIHSRSNGPMVTLTRQPAEGRSRDGGLRLGEMEKDCVLGHGASSFLKEILMDKSDNFKMFICKKCGMIAVLNTQKKLFGCKKCKNFNNITEVRVPYACKLFIQELEAMAISPRIITSKCLLENNNEYKMNI